MDTDDRRWLDAHARADGDEEALLAANIQFNELAAAYGQNRPGHVHVEVHNCAC